MLNELEWISGHIYANVWQTNSIAVISPDTGIVQRWIDVRALHPSPSDLTNATPNGIAFDQTNGKMYVTGKLWPVLYEIKFVGPA
jgi:glutaminyl-peptide cyclotransferase